jgi:hypothetical protein
MVVFLVYMEKTPTPASFEDIADNKIYKALKEWAALRSQDEKNELRPAVEMIIHDIEQSGLVKDRVIDATLKGTSVVAVAVGLVAWALGGGAIQFMATAAAPAYFANQARPKKLLQLKRLKKIAELLK